MSLFILEEAILETISHSSPWDFLVRFTQALSITLAAPETVAAYQTCAGAATLALLALLTCVYIFHPPESTRLLARHRRRSAPDRLRARYDLLRDAYLDLRATVDVAAREHDDGLLRGLDDGVLPGRDRRRTIDDELRDGTSRCHERAAELDRLWRPRRAPHVVG